MRSAQIPFDEVPRLEALRRYGVLDTPPEVSLDRITKLAASLFEVPIALVSLIDAKRQWFKSCVGMSPTDVDRKIAFCAHAILADQVLIVPDTKEDARFHDNPQVTSAPFIRFYAGAPLITPDGFRLGTLCIVDTAPRTFSLKQAEELQDFAAMVIEALEARRATAPMVAAVASTASGVIICDPRRTDLPIVFANPAFCEITGYSQEEVLGRNCRFLQGPETDRRMVEQMHDALAGRQPFRGTIRNYRKDGTPFWNELTINPVFDDFDELVSFVGIQVDATAQVEALEQTRRSEARLALAQQVAQLGSWECTFTAAGELDQRNVVWSDETYRLFGLQPGEPGDLWEHFFRRVHPDDLAVLNAAFGEAVRSRGRYSLDHRLVRPDGTLYVLHEEANTLLDEATGQPLRMVGTMQDITERKAVEDALRASEENHRALFDATPLPSWVFDLSTLAFLEVNQAAVTHYGYSREEFLSMRLPDVRPPEDVPALLVELRATASDRASLGARRHRKKDGTLIEVEISSVVTTFIGRSARLAVMTDVTESRRTQHALRESEQRFSGAFTHSPIGTAIVSSEGRWLRANPALCELVGYTEEELVTRSFQDITYPEDRELGLENLRRMLAGEIVTFQVGKRYVHADGHVINVLVSSTLVRDQHGKPSHCVTQIQDITERKKAEAALLESKRFLRSTLDALSSHIAILDEQGAIVEINQAWKHFADANGLPADHCGIGDNYLCVCDTAAGDSDAGGSELANGVRAVMAGQSEAFYLEYPSHGQEKKQWFSVRVTRFQVDGATRIVLAHDNITQRKLAEEDLRWKTAFLEAQVNSSLDGILVVDPAGKQILRNQRFVDLWKVPPHVGNDGEDAEQLRWVTNMTLDPTHFVERVIYLYAHPDEKSRDEIALKDGAFFERYSAPVIGEDGTFYGRIWTFADITERKRMVESLRESEARYQRIAANVPGMVYRVVLHPDGSFSFPFVSEGCREIYGLEPEQIQSDGEIISDVVHLEDKEEYRQSTVASASSLSPWTWQGRIIRPGTGETRCVQGASRPERQPNGDIVWDGVIMDVTERKQAEEDRRAKAEAERTNQEKSKFLSRMSHELRTPLNAILGFGQVLQFSTLEEQDALALGYILKGGQHLLSLVDEVLDLSRAESGELHLALGDVEARAVVDECVGFLERLAEARQITCTVKRPLRSVTLRCDEQRLRQVLLNLLSNAIKYNQEGGQVLVTFEPVPVNQMRINVTDAGPGISAGNIARLFVPFERLEQEHGEVEGTGLGLVVSRRIAEAMDGSVGVKSEVGRGSTFWIELPLAASVPAVPTDLVRLLGPSIPNAEALPGATLLYIEDNLSNLQVMEMLLARRRPQWRFVSARDGCKGLALARQQLPDLILLDLQMPGMPGEDVLDELRRDPATQEIPVIVLSADATAHSRERLLARGADEYVSKPFQVEPVLELFERALGRASVSS